MVQSFQKGAWHFLKKLNIQLPYNLSIPFLGIYPREMEAMSMERFVHKLMSAVFVVSGSRLERPKCPSTCEWKKEIGEKLSNKKEYLCKMNGIQRSYTE